MYNRILRRPKKSFFLFGPRGTGKSHWLARELPEAKLVLNLLRASQYLEYKKDPSLLFRQVMALPKGSWIVIDEVQKIPELLDEVHAILFASEHSYNFALSGSSARKLKRSEANMLAGRAISKKMFPFSASELGEDFSLEQALRYGCLPMSVKLPSDSEKAEYLDAYVETYLKEEIMQEALVRNLDSFYRFLTVTARMNGEILNISNISRDVGVARSTVQSYFSILQDTLIGWNLPAWRRQVKVKEVHHPKFYLFDTGVQRGLAGLLREGPRPEEKGHLLETLFLNELRAVNSWKALGVEFSYWRTEAGTEVDVICTRGQKTVAFEVKYSASWKSSNNRALNTLLSEGFIEKAFGVYVGDKAQLYNEIRVLPFLDAIKKFEEEFAL